MKVNFYATLRPIVGQKTVEFPLSEGMTVQTLLDAVLDAYPAMRPEMVDENGQLYRHVHFFVNGRDAHFLTEGMDTVLKATDTINMFPAVGGGSW